MAALNYFLPDLSFNKIRELSGLENLHKLTDLSLYHNEIETINYEAIENCKELNVLSLGRNRISDIKQAVKIVEVVDLVYIPVTQLQPRHLHEIHRINLVIIQDHTFSSPPLQ